jgi:hypothetical protein
MIHVDSPSVRDETEALVLMEHHLKLAAHYFEATPEQWPHSFAEDHFSHPAIVAWAKAMEALYPKD